MSYICEVSGYCPIQDTDTSIDVKYTEIRVLGSTHNQNQYKKTLDYCDYDGVCPEKLCSIVKNAPSIP